MNLKRLLCSATAWVLAAVLLCPYTASAKSSDVISAALGEVGYTEGAHEYSKYGAWYGLPNSYWCDMFVSWCGKQANISTQKFPRHCSCTAHVKRFSELGLYQNSAARGGSYIPQQGDVIFFYNHVRYPSGSVKNHTGLVLYVEGGYVFTIEGNALANRLDFPYVEISMQRDGDLEPPDYVTVNCYPLTDPHIHGYGTPAYNDRTPLALTGFVDLGRHTESAALFQSVHDAGIMPGTSSHTFSPNHGITRGDFLMLVADLFGLSGYEESTPAFSDVPPESSCYAAVMTARSAGLVIGVEDNTFLPQRYITPSSAQLILSQVQAYVGLEEEEFAFSVGDYGYINSPYIIRADLAKALSALSQRMPVSEAFTGEITLDGTVVDWPARLLNGVCYVPASALLAALEPEGDEPEEIPDTDEKTEEETQDTDKKAEDETQDTDKKTEDEAQDTDKKTEDEAQDTDKKMEDEAQDTDKKTEDEAQDTDEKTEDALETEEPASKEESGSPANRLPVPLGSTERVVSGPVTLRTAGVTAVVNGLTYQGTPYAALSEAAMLLPLHLEWIDANHAVLTTETSVPADSAA